jgi:hypothetical protein
MDIHFESGELDLKECEDKIEYEIFNYYAWYHISKLKNEDDLRFNCMTTSKSINKKRKLKNESI